VIVGHAPTIAASTRIVEALSFSELHTQIEIVLVGEQLVEFLLAGPVRSFQLGVELSGLRLMGARGRVVLIFAAQLRCGANRRAPRAVQV
jgi:hypothetical protein